MKYKSKSKSKQPEKKVKGKSDKQIVKEFLEKRKWTPLKEESVEVKTGWEEPKEATPAHECPCCKNRCLCCNHLSGTVTDRCTCRCKTEASH